MDGVVREGGGDDEIEEEDIESIATRNLQSPSAPITQDYTTGYFAVTTRSMGILMSEHVNYVSR